ncbi:polysaccharide biosynthesis protein [Providencia burhodogranariea]|uniref:Polysaccharide biosynthesis protein n=1 Tax=Providencia burhodogranariea DSM 19968 TaxID=1141662 RepID=K8W0P7_9GAMM|nr:polysaccharide biosynthesis protein [Providencia burhodogranariea]EKT54123.1 polysaccharide biosynthesis protein [Providencia burhodogranariea DSM 19968]
MTNHKNNNRIVKNTLFLYFRMIITLLLSLYTSRVILQTLGIDDFGIFNVVAGIVTMLSFMSGAMTSATQRFFSYELGKNDQKQLSNVFKMSMNIHILIIVASIIIAETIGVWFLNTYIIIPQDRIIAANWVFQFSIISFCITVLSIPYTANIIAHEKMRLFAYIGIIDVVLKLIIVFLLRVTNEDKLITYSILLSIVNFLVLFFYYLYNKYNFRNSNFKLYWDKILFKKLFSYTGWNLFGNLASVGYNQGINILLNIFFGPSVNAARAISFQVNTAISGFVANLQTSVSPQIVKSYAINDINNMKSLVFSCSKYSFFLMYFLSLPILLKTEYILEIWLGEIPDYTVIFCQLLIIDTLIISFSSSLMTAFQATGKIKGYQIIVGSLLILNIPLSYLILTLGAPPQYTYTITITLSLIALTLRLKLLELLIPKITSGFYSNVILKSIIIVVLSFIPSWIISKYIDNHILHFIILCISVWLIVITSIWLIGFNASERQYIKNIILRKFNG